MEQLRRHAALRPPPEPSRDLGVCAASGGSRCALRRAMVEAYRREAVPEGNGIGDGQRRRVARQGHGAWYEALDCAGHGLWGGAGVTVALQGRPCDRRGGGLASALKPRLRLRQAPPPPRGGAPGGSDAAPAPEGSLTEAWPGLNFVAIRISGA